MHSQVPMLETQSKLEFEQRHWDLAYRVALRIVGSHDKAQDIAQDTILKAYLARDSFAERSKPESWLYRIAHNTAISHLRKPFHRRRAGADIDYALEQRPVDHFRPQEDTVAASELYTHLQDFLSGLNDKDRTAFTEKYILEATETELGEILGVTPNAAKQRAFRVRRAAASKMESFKAAS